MEVICKGFHTGKTAELIKMCAEKGGYIVCADIRRADNVQAMARKLGCNIPYPITFRDLLDRKYHAKGVRKVYIDDADELLRMLARGVKIAAVVINNTSSGHLDIAEENRKMGARWR